ncbi:glycosyltransferase [Mycolicibacterium sp. P1-5]|uniref:glycosyltransferase n=1 Tax=Mycolicibacterium sp. P1-5 TaxID=2024617 RepID=UPI0011ECE187|nr:nucleotide disphospho-sugar-binding domain-containing protein [Mycolicibacterium sp. P1-5]KAA0104616.1 glycosyltransferase [Mycolicibacterium sp. P1-5]
MPTILAYGSPALGHLLPISALLGELAERGNDVHLRTLAAGVATGERRGVRSEPVDPRIEAIVSEDWTARSSFGVLEMTIDTLCRRAVLEVDDLQRAIAEVDPDVLVVDANCWGAMSVADAGGLPWSVFSPFTPFLRSRGLPPVGPGMRPWPGVPGRIRDHGVRSVVSRVMDRPMLPRINALRAAVGAPLIDSVDGFLRRAPLMLVVGGEPFEYPHPDWGDQVHLIGACTDDTDVEVPDWLAAIDEPVVLVTTSSVRQADAQLGRTALEALAEEPVRVIATFPAGVPPDLVVPPNAIVHQYLPHEAVLGRAACAVTHGGMGATVRALNRGVPVCVVPFGRDQREVATRVEVAGCGTRLPSGRLTRRRLRAKIRQAMTMTDGAREVAAGFAATGGVARGADLIEQQLACGRKVDLDEGVR